MGASMTARNSQRFSGFLLSSKVMCEASTQVRVCHSTAQNRVSANGNGACVGVIRRVLGIAPSFLVSGSPLTRVSSRGRQKLAWVLLYLIVQRDGAAGFSAVTNATARRC